MQTAIYSLSFSTLPLPDDKTQQLENLFNSELSTVPGNFTIKLMEKNENRIVWVLVYPDHPNKRLLNQWLFNAGINAAILFSSVSKMFAHAPLNC